MLKNLNLNPGSKSFSSHSHLSSSRSSRSGRHIASTSTRMHSRSSSYEGSSSQSSGHGASNSICMHSHSPSRTGYKEVPRDIDMDLDLSQNAFEGSSDVHVYGLDNDIEAD